MTATEPGPLASPPASNARKGSDRVDLTVYSGRTAKLNDALHDKIQADAAELGIDPALLLDAAIVKGYGPAKAEIVAALAKVPRVIQ